LVAAVAAVASYFKVEKLRSYIQSNAIVFDGGGTGGAGGSNFFGSGGGGGRGGDGGSVNVATPQK
jgi:hypothetical protein